MMFPFSFAKACSGGNFLSFPTWYKYLDGATDPHTHVCSPQLTSLNDVWLIVAAIIEILLRVVVLMAVGYVIFGGVKYIKSEGNPEQTSLALKTIIYALAGMAIAILATAAVAFIAGGIH